MSEYQLILFRAIDRPLNQKQLDYMDGQSSRAEYSEWEFEVEYNYSSFRGDVDGMLRNGYDIHLKYTNCGGNEIRIRLPRGLPFPKKVYDKYLDVTGIRWIADKKGKGGILSVAPFIEEYDFQGDDPDDFMDAVAELREMLLSGDLRALYVLWLCCTADVNDDFADVMEPPVPHGIADVSDNVKTLLSLFMADPWLVDAAGEGIARSASRVSIAEIARAWIKSMPPSGPAKIVERLVSEDPWALKSELLSSIRNVQEAAQWPTSPAKRTVEELSKVAVHLHMKDKAKQQRIEAAKAQRAAKREERDRQKRIEAIKLAPDEWLAKASVLVEQRGRESYAAAAAILADCRDAIGGAAGEKIARKHAAKLVRKYPTLTVLKSYMKKNGLLA